MILNLIRWTILVLILWYMPSFLLSYIGGSLGSIASYGTSIGLLAYFILSKNNRKPAYPFFFIGLSYFIICSLHGTLMVDQLYFLKENIRFLIVAFCSAAVLRKTSEKEIFFILMIGSLSIIINALVFPMMQPGGTSDYGRFSGFYLNPNLAGSACLLGYALSFAIKDIKWKVIGQIAFTLGGIFTFSRTFIVIWVLISLLTIYHNKKNIIIPILGGVILILVISFSSSLTLNTSRFSALETLVTGKPGDTSAVNKDRRDESWALYYDLIFEKPFFGYGYTEFQRQKPGYPGVHNTYLMIIGEAGIIPLLLLLSIYLNLIFRSFQNFNDYPWIFYTIIVLAISMMAGHGYFYNFITVFMSIFVYVKLERLQEIKST